MPYSIGLEKIGEDWSRDILPPLFWLDVGIHGIQFPTLSLRGSLIKEQVGKKEDTPEKFN